MGRERGTGLRIWGEVYVLEGSRGKLHHHKPSSLRLFVNQHLFRRVNKHKNVAKMTCHNTNIGGDG